MFPQLEDFGDGYTNEFQRMYAVSQMTTQITDDRAKAVRLAESGRYVVVMEGEVCCRVTDALIGMDFSIQGDFGTEVEAVAAMRGFEESPEFYIMRPQNYRPVLVIPPDMDHGSEVPSDEDECPF